MFKPKVDLTVLFMFEFKNFQVQVKFWSCRFVVEKTSRCLPHCCIAHAALHHWCIPHAAATLLHCLSEHIYCCCIPLCCIPKCCIAHAPAASTYVIAHAAFHIAALNMLHPDLHSTLYILHPYCCIAHAAFHIATLNMLHSTSAFYITHAAPILLLHCTCCFPHCCTNTNTKLHFRSWKWLKPAVAVRCGSF